MKNILEIIKEEEKKPVSIPLFCITGRVPAVLGWVM